MGFGDRVSALLETYDNCLSLLKAFKQSTNKDGKKSSRKAIRTSEQQALLRHSLRADRKKVERAYSSKVSESGSEFVKGDSKARSALGKVLKRLNAAIANLMRLASKSPDPLMDYQSLMSLSCSSRVQTIKTFDQLSRRLGSSGGSSRGSVVSTATSSGSNQSGKTITTTATSKSSRSEKTTTSRRKHGKKSSAPDKSSSAASERRMTRTTAPPPPPPANHDSSFSNRRRDRERERDRDMAPPRLETSILTPMLDMMVMGRDGERRDRDASPLRRQSSLSLMRRFSIVSISSASTKLGEIPERRWDRRRTNDGWAGPGGIGGSLDEYSAPTVYPLKPYQPVVKERRFMGLFRRG